MAFRRSVLVLLGAVALATLVASCSVVSPAPETSAAAKPAAGECWNGVLDHAEAWADWQGAAAVSCTAKHTLYTYAVGTISGETASTWGSAANPSALSAAIETKAARACDIATLLPHLLWNQQLIDDFFFVPTEAQWKSGARWVRCDVGELAFGTTLTAESLRALPAKISTLAASVASDPKRYELCVNSTVSTSAAGPLDDPHATIADCTKHPQWTLAAHGTLPEAAGAAFPDDATANAQSTTICAPAAAGDGEVWIAYLPTTGGWAADDREVTCWVAQKTLVGGQTA